MHATKPKSNTWVVFIPILLWFIAAYIYIEHFQNKTHGKYDYLLASGISLWFLTTAVAQIRSGYFWQNGSPGNLGMHQSTAPKKFVISTAFHFLLGTAIAAFFIYQHFKHH